MNMLKGLIQVYRNIVTENLTGDDLIDAFDTADICEVELAAKDAVIEAALPLRTQLGFVYASDADEKTLKLTLTAKECRALAAALERVQAEER